MFSPTKFPCTAWYVTAALNVRQLLVTDETGYSDCYRTDAGFKYQDEMFGGRDEAVGEACRRLLLARERHKKAGERLARLDTTVARLREGGAA